MGGEADINVISSGLHLNELRQKRFSGGNVSSSAYLAKLLDHLLDADVSVLGDLALHVGEPLAELLVLLVEHRPLVQLLAHLLPS